MTERRGPGRPRGIERRPESGARLAWVVARRGHRTRESFVQMIFSPESGETISALRNRVASWTAEGLVPARPHVERIAAAVCPDISQRSAAILWLVEGTSPPPCIAELAITPEQLQELAELSTSSPAVAHPEMAHVQPAEPVTLREHGTIVPVMVEGLERALAALKRGEDPTALLEGVIRIAHEARIIGLACAMFCLMTLSAFRADALDSGSSTRKSVQVQVLSSALRLLLRLIRRALRAGGSAGPTPPDDSLTAAGAYGYGSVHSLADIRARYFLPKSGRARGRTGRPAGRRVG